MAINGLTTGTNTNLTASYESYTVTAEITKTTASESDAVVYTRSSDKDSSDSSLSAAAGKVDTKTIEELKADAEERTASLRSLVEKMLLKQAGTYTNSTGLASIFRKLEVDEETQAQAQEDTSEDGYWGVEQTSDRIVSFAKALAGDDAETAESMLEAIKEGFEQAGSEWGEDLPQLSQDTMQAVLDKMQEYIDSLKDGSSDSQTSSASTASSAGSTVKITATYTKAQIQVKNTAETTKITAKQAKDAAGESESGDIQ